jgi:hypothetical protein
VKDVNRLLKQVVEFFRSTNARIKSKIDIMYNQEENANNNNLVD